MKHNFRNKDELLKEAFKQREQLGVVGKLK